MAELKKLSNFGGVPGPVLTIVMDGVGIAPDCVGNAVTTAIVGTLLSVAYAAAKPKAGSLNKED